MLERQTGAVFATVVQFLWNGVAKVAVLVGDELKGKEKNETPVYENYNRSFGLYGLRATGN
jgi:hypothetical protein